MTLNQIAEKIAFSLGDQFNTTLREAIKHTVIVYRAKLIKDDLDRNFTDYFNYLQSFIIEFEKVDRIEGCDNCKIMKSTKPVPKPLRVKFGKSSFKYVGDILTGTPFIYAGFEELKFLKSLPYQQNIIYYSWDNNYMYLLNNLKLCKARVEAIFADPRVIDLTCTEKSQMFSDDKEFPISINLLFYIEKSIINGEFPIITDGKEVPLKEETN